MCGRMILFRLGRFTDLFPWIRPGFDPGPRYNVSPMTDIPAVINDGTFTISLLRWGLVPSWSKDARVGSKMINARSETVLEKPSFKHAVQSRRCLIPADGFYEWQTVPGRARKTPHYIRSQTDRPLMFAGLWDRATIGGQILKTCTVLTTPANSMMSQMHDRMPVILPEQSWRDWLEETSTDTLQGMLVPASEDVLIASPVGVEVGNVRNEGPRLIESGIESGIESVSESVSESADEPRSSPAIAHRGKSLSKRNIKAAQAGLFD